MHNLQSDILELRNAAVAGQSAEAFAHSRDKRPLTLDDRSLSIHVCHSPQREVEVLHDRLLAMLEADPTLTPRDIIVMVADIDSYSPYRRCLAPPARSLAAVGDLRPSRPRVAPGAAGVYYAAHCRTAALPVKMCWRCWTSRCWRRAITEEGLRYLRQWVNESGVRWEWMTTTSVSWTCRRPGSIRRFGLTRMLLGYAMDSREENGSRCCHMTNPAV